VVLSILAAVAWGTADFLGGLSARRLAVLAVLFFSQVIGLVLAGLVMLLGGLSFDAEYIWWGVMAGVVGSLGLGLFYAGLAAGAMSLVAPISACGAVVPVVVAVVGGEELTALTVVGMAIALTGAVLVSRSEGEHLRLTPNVIALAVGAGLAFGAVITAFQQGGQGGDDASMTVVLAARAASLAATCAALLATRTAVGVPSPSVVPLLLGVGLGDTGANIVLTLASGSGQDALVAVLASMYPVITVVLAGVLLKERLSALQAAGVAAALAGVAIVSAA
jgi:drug/metabolite transporter (DMT)-like permease